MQSVAVIQHVLETVLEKCPFYDGHSYVPEAMSVFCTMQLLYFTGEVGFCRICSGSFRDSKYVVILKK